jgi:hypothetical protein
MASEYACADPADRGRASKVEGADATPPEGRTAIATENCAVDRERQWFELPASIPHGAVHGFVPVASRARHHVACQELHDAVGDGLGLLDVEEVTDAVDGAVLDVRE